MSLRDVYCWTCAQLGGRMDPRLVPRLYRYECVAAVDCGDGVRLLCYDKLTGLRVALGTEGDDRIYRVVENPAEFKEWLEHEDRAQLAVMLLIMNKMLYALARVVGRA